MALDATGTPSPNGIPKYLTSTDAPSGKGLNAIVDSIDTLITSALKSVWSKAGSAVGTRRGANFTDTGEIAITVADDAGNDRVNVSAALVAVAPSKLTGYPTDVTKVLKGDGTWATVTIPTVPRCIAYTTSTQAITNNTATAVALPSEMLDTDTMHDLVTNNSRLTVKTAGVYRITARCNFATTSAGQVRRLMIYKNGAQLALSDQLAPAANLGAGYDGAPGITYYVTPIVNDYFEMFVLQDSGGNLNTIAGSGDFPQLAMELLG